MKNSNVTAKRIFMCAIIFIACLSVQFLIAQTAPNRLAQLIQNKKATESFKSVSPFNISINESIYDKVSKGSVFTVSESDLRQIIKENSKAIKLIIPVNNTPGFELELSKAYIGGDDINVTLKGNHEPIKKKIKSGLHYRGIIKGNESSYASISVHENTISGIISNGNGNYVLGKLKNEKDQYVFYNERDLISPQTFQCATSDKLSSIINSNLKNGNNSTLATNSDCKVIKCFYECDYQMFLDFNSYIAVANFITDAFAQVATLYFNEGVICEFSEDPLTVWIGSDFYLDKYPLGSTADLLINALPTVIAEEGSSFTGDIAQFITSREDIHPPGSGGVAAVINSLCNKYLSHAFVNIKPTSIYGFPDYLSFTAAILAHEMGHLLGSPHTHACFWNGDNTALDDCPTYVEPLNGCNVGTTPPPSLYTTMSYCFPHDFNEGFGPQPAALIYGNVSDAGCYEGSSEFIPINLTVNSGVLNWDAVSGATEYTIEFKLEINDGCSYENFWIPINSIPTNYYDLGNYSFIHGSNYRWRVKSDCSPFSDESSFSMPFSSNTDPQALTTYDNIGPISTLCWEKCNNCVYDIRYRQVGDPTWNTQYSLTNNYLRVYDIYNENEWQVSNQASSNWITGPNFEPIYNWPENLTYCATNGDNSANYYIDEVDILYYQTWITGASSSGYEEFWDGNMYWQENIDFTIVPVDLILSGEIFITMFIDWNGDGDHNDEGEDVYRILGPINDISPINETFSTPSNFIGGGARLRISYMFPNDNHFAPAQCGTIGYGEVEDYLVWLDPKAICAPARFSFEINPNIKIFPNPASDFIKIVFKNGNDKVKASAKVINLAGQVVKTFDLSNGTSDINVKDLAKGFYQVSIFSKDKIQKNVKFIKL